MVAIQKAKQGFRRGQKQKQGRSLGPYKGKGNGKGILHDNPLYLWVMVIIVVVIIVVAIIFGLGGNNSGAMSGSNSDGSSSSSSSNTLLHGDRLRFRKPHIHVTLPVDEEEEEEKTTTTDKQDGEEQEKRHQRRNRPRRQPRPQLNMDAFDAMAVDIIETLDCTTLMTQAMDQLHLSKNSQQQEQDADKNEEVEQREWRRRRLLSTEQQQQQLQHGDDGGFDNLLQADANNINNKRKMDIAAIASKDDNDDEEDPEMEKWGRQARGNGNGNGGFADDDQIQKLEGRMGNSQDDMNASAFGGEYDDLTMSTMTWNAQHLFCLVAMEEPPPEMVQQFDCAMTTHKRKLLLDLWTDARAQIQNESLLKDVLSYAQEWKSQTLLDETVSIWAPSEDTGIQYMINTINNEMRSLLETTLGSSLSSPNTNNNDNDNDNNNNNDNSKVFVDVGSGLGLTTLAVTQKYPKTHIVSIEPASPNWLLQEMNLRCNLNLQTTLTNDNNNNSNNKKHPIKVILAGVGPNTEDEEHMLAKLMWKPTASLAARSWTPENEFNAEDNHVELLVQLRPLSSILAEANIFYSTNKNNNNNNHLKKVMDVMNIDCQGCEYNLIPAMSEEMFEAIPNIMGGVHWGYIPISKLPSTTRGEATHRRLCQHETIAKTTKECCAFPNLPVKSNIPGEVLYRENDNVGGDKENKNGNQIHNPFPIPVTVGDIIPESLCENFDEWAEEHFLYRVADDYGWFELSSRAATG